MNRQGMLERMPKVVILGVTVLVVVLLLVKSAPAQAQRSLYPWEFSEVAPQGFGDRHNSWAWSMQWWNGKLYVGTHRAEQCVTSATLAHHLHAPWLYPPLDKDIECTECPQDLPLQAEIWRFDPEREHWEWVYQSPDDVEIPGHPGKYTACDLGFRDMIVFTEPDGTDALYVCGVSSLPFNPGVPPPRILRSTDGVNFEPIPQDPGTVLGDLGECQASFRDMEIYKGRLYVTNGKLRGTGALLEAENPAGGNDNFRWVTPDDMVVYELAPFNGFLYVCVADNLKGFSIVKTDATGTPPYTFKTVVEKGGSSLLLKSASVVHMHVFEGRLYAGTDKPAELIRINPDDTWDLIVGKPRWTRYGWKYPLSGMDAGFDFNLNGHIYRLKDHDGWLYLGTMDQSTAWRVWPEIEEKLRASMGFDLFTTPDGWYFTPITRTGFDHEFDYALRTFASTPYGLFLGTTNEYFGLRIWQGIPGCVDLYPPERLAAESKDDIVVLSWEAPPGAACFHIFKADFISSDPEFKEIGITNHFTFVDNNDRPYKVYHYYVVAEDAVGNMSGPSNFIRAPSLFPPVTFGSLNDTLVGWKSPIGLRLELGWAKFLVKIGKLENALRKLEQLRQRVNDDPSLLEPWHAEDFVILLGKLERRVHLAQVGLIDPSDLL